MMMYKEAVERFLAAYRSKKMELEFSLDKANNRTDDERFLLSHSITFADGAIAALEDVIAIAANG